ncbi:hypothetical protein [Paraflavitalea sp. CAU 1676]|uniref:hypothetical protein n=1 Tax=Paraflavitalea sp. CAU 1676 TaxID=3032598 RepID=UPI0023DB2B75|nr:hypothetical protein [Paraflavitalea sp. CAU 1676]MDF2187272.1 hypothetical protein [Paraflavitalea sp. CAU 1676]
MTNNETIRIEIDKQIAAGFSADEIRSNLLSQKYHPDEVNSAMRQTGAAARANSPAGFGIASVLVSIFLIISGIMKVNRYESGSISYIFGFIMLIGGIGGLIFKVVDMSRR